MDEIEIERFRCMACGHVWWAEPGHHFGHVEYDGAGRRFNFYPYPLFAGQKYKGCYRCGGVYFEWTTYEAFAKRRAAWGGVRAESLRVEERHREGLEIIDNFLRKHYPIDASAKAV